MSSKDYLRRGFFNRYNEEKPAIDRYIKDLSHLLWSIRYFLTKGRIKWLVAHPHYPARKSTMFKIARKLGYHVTNRPKKNASLITRYDYFTFKKETPYLDELAKTKKVVNYRSRDISKKRIDEVHLKVFGYNTQINPETFKGSAVQKNNTNGLHDGKIISCPISNPDHEQFIYQILIDNKTENGFFEDIRVAVMGNQLPQAYLKYREPQAQFGHKSTAKLAQVEEVLSNEEIQLVKQLMQRLAIDFAEIDILRDRNTNKIYVIDVNDTPNSARDNVSKPELKRNIAILAKAFKEEFIEKS